MPTENYRIKHALFLQGWKVGDDTPILDSKGQPVRPTDYDPSMDDQLFCPRCYTPLTRKPKDKPYFSNGRLAGFSHLPSYHDVPCPLRSKTPEGERFATEVEAQEAVSRGELVVVSEFAAQQPESPAAVGTYDQSQVVDVAGPLSDTALGRHDGPIYTLPTRITAVSTLCRNFSSNLSRYYLFPGQHVPARLEDQLTSVMDAREVTDEPRLYWGFITTSQHMGSKKPWNLRMTYLRCAAGIADFCLKDSESNQHAKGIGDKSKGRILLAWSKVTKSGVGLSFDAPGWGCYALLPEKYNSLLLGG